MSVDINKIHRNLASNIDPILVEKLLHHYKILKDEFFLGHFEKCQLQSGKFVEIIIRILEFLITGNYTPFNRTINLDRITAQVQNAQTLKDSIRINIPRTLRTIYDIRNRRGVAHVGEIDPNLIDSNYVVSACDWIVAEILRIYHVDKIEEVKLIIDTIFTHEIPIIQEFEDDLIVLESKLSVAKKILIILYQKYPNYVSIENLKKWIKVKTKTHIITVINQLEKNSLIHRNKNEAIITKKGINYVKNTLDKSLLS